MIKLRNMTIKKKLTVIMMVASAAVVTLSCLIFMVSSFWLLRKNHADKDMALARLIGSNIQAALMFNVPEDAEKILSSLESDSSIVFACIYTVEGKPFSVYQRQGSGPAIEPPAMLHGGYEHSGGYLSLFHDIFFKDKKIGSIYLLDDQTEVYASLRWDFTTLIIIIVITLVSAYLLANKLQGVISGPILSLAETAGAIRTTKDYSIRAEEHGSDEVGVLIDSFNSMLNEIQKREDALATSEAKFRSIVETTSDWIWEVDADGRYVYASPRIKDLLGYEPQEVLGKRPCDLMPPEESERLKARFAELSKVGKPFEGIENINLHKDGRQIVLETSGVPIFDDNGKCCGYRGIDRDITERRRSEEKLRESSAMLKMVIDNIPQFIFWKDCNLIYTGCNQNFARAAGFDTPKELIGKTDYDMAWKKEEADFYRSCDERIMSSDKAEYHIIEPQQQTDGTNAWLDTNKVPLHDSEGRVIGILGTYEDITERKRYEQEIADLARFPAENKSPVLRISRDSKLLYANDASKTLLDEWNCVVGEPVPDYLQRNVADTLSEKVEKIIELQQAEIVYSFMITPIPEAGYVNLYGRDITERKRSQEALKISEANYRSIFDSVNDGIFIHEIDTGKIINTNRQTRIMFGYSAEELQNMSVGDISVAEEGFTQKKAIEMIKKAGREGTQLFEWRLRNKFDRVFWSEVSLRAVVLEGKRCMLALVRDIDERKRAEDALASSESRFRALAENANSGMISVNNYGQIIFWNPAAEEMFGYSSAEALGQLFSLILSEEHYEAYSHDLEQIRLIGKSSYTGKLVEFNGLKKGGLEFPIEMSLSQWSTPEGLFFTAILTDITERKKAAEAIRLDEARLQVLVELNQMTDVTEKELVDFSLEQAISLTKSKIGYIAFMNDDETVLNMYSWSRTAMAECSIIDKPLIYPVAETGLWGEAVRQRRPIITNDYQGPEPLKKGYPEGHVHIRRHMNIPVFDGGKIVAVAGVGNKEEEYDNSDVRQLTLLMDGMWRIIQRNKTEDELKALLKTLASKNEELESIVYTASHDLRSPLVNIDGFSSELASSCQELTETLTHTDLPENVENSLQTVLKEDIPASLKYIRSSATKMDMLMRGLLKLSRLGREATEIETLDMNELIGNVNLGMQHQIQKQKVELIIDQLPSCLGDKTQISQVFTNLLDNAIKYLDPAKKGKIRISGTSQDGESIYSVKDNGVGINQECHDKIFEVFHRLDPEGSVSGEGIGLTIVKRIIDRHNGRIWLESSVGGGTAFHVALRNSN
ncbi:MAG: PAS domain S-box protein [Phycisphaerae bacterium]|nr:PAS domain S-box protein [Phycisphaerae bacterium]